MKKLLLVLLAVMLVFTFAACGEEGNTDADNDAVTLENIKIGAIHINSEADQGYSYAHIKGIKAMAEELGLAEDQVIFKENVPEDGSCADAIKELIEAGCNIIFADSFGHETYMLEAAKENPDIVFCHATGNKALDSGLDNFHNYFGNIYEARYLCGIVAGHVSLEIENNKLGYVSAMKNTECISGFTGFYLGAKSVNADATMEVVYNNTWYDVTIESNAAQALIDRGAGILCQHADSPATQTTAQQNEAYAIGYNSDMSSAAPEANLCSAIWDWSVPYKYYVEAYVNGEEMQPDFCGNLENGMVNIVLNDDLLKTFDCYDDIVAGIDQAKEDIISGDLYPYVVGPFTGTGIDAASNETTIELADGEKYIEKQSAPSWGFLLDGITVVE